jgi:formate hydrogenlyase subunit 6/NADH:ubiquinone oxidoreductase subunit I
MGKMRNQEQSEKIQPSKVPVDSCPTGAVIYTNAFALKKKKTDYEIAAQQILDRAKKTDW